MKIIIDIPQGTQFERKPFVSNSWVRAEVRKKLLPLPFHPDEGRPFRAQMKTTYSRNMDKR